MCPQKFMGGIRPRKALAVAFLALICLLFASPGWAKIPELTALSVDRLPAGSPAFVLVVDGLSFHSTKSVVRWNGADRPTMFLSTTRLSATIFSTDLVVPGTVDVSVFTYGNTGGTSVSLPFAIDPALPLALSSKSLPGGVEGTNYRASLAVTGGTPPYLWSISANSLPGGLALDPNSGEISGRPTRSGKTAFTARVTDSASPPQSVSADFYIRVVVVEIATKSLPAGTVGMSYSFLLSVAGGRSPYTWSLLSGQLPNGLVLDSATGNISGTPEAEGSFAFTIQVSDVGASTASAQLSIDIAPASGSGALLAFPGADGFGALTPGGRGGQVLYVTRLDDAREPGTLRYALESRGPRVVLFRVSGTIQLRENISITEPFVTVAGQSAPGEGVQIKGAMIIVRASDVVIRYLRLRPGDEINRSDNCCRDALLIEGSAKREISGVIIDHSTLIWGPDTGGPEIISNAHHISIQWSILGEGLFRSNHYEGYGLKGHSKGVRFAPNSASPELAPSSITLHHNLIANSDDRNPLLDGVETAEMVNNVVYNWGLVPAEGAPRSLNMTNNFFLPGPLTQRLLAWKPLTGHLLLPQSVYEAGTVTQDFFQVRGDPQFVYTDTRFDIHSLFAEHTAQQAYDLVIRQSGAALPVRDAADQRIIRNVLDRTGAFVNGVSFGLTWPFLTAGPLRPDTDLDGMPDDWELLHFGTLTRGSPTDSSSDFDGDGYTDLEEFLNGTNPTVPDRPPATRSVW